MALQNTVNSSTIRKPINRYRHICLCVIVRIRFVSMHMCMYYIWIKNRFRAIFSLIVFFILFLVVTAVAAVDGYCCFIIKY